MPWTPEQIERLRALAPLSSPLEISRILGMTKNAVMGKMRRLNIAIRDARGKWPELSYLEAQKRRTELGEVRHANRYVRSVRKSQAVAYSNRRRAERSTIWTPEKIALLRLLAPIGGSGAIAQKLCLSKGQVRAKAQRLGISIGRPKLGLSVAKVSRPIKVVFAPLPPPVVVASVPAPPLPIVELVCEGVDFAGLKRHSCRYPVKCDHNGFIRLYCGESARPESSWCGFHEKVVFGCRLGKERRRA